MTLVGILSDTHIHDHGDAMALAEYLLDGPFAGVDLVLHAGDILLPELLGYFHPIPTKGVRGNCDPANPQLPTKRVVQVEQCRIGLIHGWGGLSDLEQRVRSEFTGESLDALVFGHSHQPLCQTHDGLLCFNPGSATDRRRAPEHTVGLLCVDDGRIEGKLIPLPW